METQTPAELLHENRHGFRGSQEHDEVDARNVDALIEEIDDEQDRHAASREFLDGRDPVGGVRTGVHGKRRNAGRRKHPRHVPGMVDGYAEAERRVAGMTSKVLDR